jgi:hypothetical protein
VCLSSAKEKAFYFTGALWSGLGVPPPCPQMT